MSRFAPLGVRGRFAVVLACVSFCPSLSASDTYDIRAHYSKHEYYVPMRDGVKLFTSVYTPKDTTKKYPFLMTRTPYSVAPYGPDSYRDSLGPHDGFAEEGFIFVYQDVRGRLMSEGEFANVRPFLPDKAPQDVDESTDTYDTVEWLLKNIPDNNGRVGIYGISYPGFYTAYGIIDGHPAIKAASPQAPVANWFVGDDFHHHGAFLLQDAFAFFSRFGQPRPEPTTESAPRFDFGIPDAYRFYLEMGPLSNANSKYLHGQVAFWNDLMEHDTYDAFWRRRNLIPHMRNVKAAVMVVAGLFDAEDPYGPVKIYHETEKLNPGIANTLVLGPWSHGGWIRTEGDRLGNVEFHLKTGQQFRQTVDLPFFKHYLKDEGNSDLPEALVFVTGSNQWRRFTAWPPASVEPKSLYLRQSGGVSFDPPVAGETEFDEYESDPAKPVPYTQEVRIDRNIEYMVEDQRFASRRPDVLVYQSAPLAKEVTLTGPVQADLFVSTTGTDADFVVKLIDVFPDDFPDLEKKDQYWPTPMPGYEMLVRWEVMRAKFRDDYSSPKAMVPGETTRLGFAMPDVAHTFKAGHRIMMQIQSSFFPLVDRNPQRFVPIAKASPEDFQKARQRVFHSPRQASRLEVNVLTEP